MKTLLRAIKRKCLGQSSPTNNINFQRSHWEDQLKQYDWDDQKLYGYDWGDPENDQDPLGNYAAIKSRVTNLLTPEKTILEIGSLGGKWTQYFLKAKEVICVDLNEVGFKYIEQKMPSDRLRFYLTKGDELRGINGNSVDIVFSMDSLVRTPRKYLFRYFKEIHRVLKPSGRMMIHLPFIEKEGSASRGFINLTAEEIRRWCRKAKLKIVDIDKKTIEHGIILEATKQ